MITWKHNIFPLLGYLSMGSVIAVLIMMAIAYGLWLLLPIPLVLWLYLRLFIDVPWRRKRVPSRHDQIEKLLQSKREVETKSSQDEEKYENPPRGNA